MVMMYNLLMFCWRWF